MLKKEKVAKNEITSIKTRRKSSLKFIPFFTDLVIMAVVKVEKIKIQPNAGNFEPSQIIVDCQALDSLGFVFNVTLMFTTTRTAIKNKITADMEKDAIYMIKGRYNIYGNSIIVLDPKYISLPKSFNERKVQKVFKINSNLLAKNKKEIGLF